MQQFDIAIVGGGLVGAAFARVIANLGLSIVLIDKLKTTEVYSTNQDNRGIAISYATKQFLAKLDLWDKISASAYPIENVHVSQRGSFGFTKLSARQMGLPALGFVISASILAEHLIGGLDTIDSLTVLRPAAIKNATYETLTESWHLQLEQTAISAKLVVACDGSNSIMRQIANIGVYEKNFYHKAVVCNINTRNVLNTTAYERFSDQGVLALLPFGPRQMKCIWTAENIFATNLLDMREQEFISELHANIGYRVGEISGCSEKLCFPITTTHIDNIVSNRLVFLGNAANCLHPVAAQGLNLGMRDVNILYELLANKVKYNTTKDYNFVLAQYKEQRVIDQRKTRNFCNNLVAIFDKGTMRTLTGFGLSCLEFIPSIKHMVTETGVGAWR